MNKKIEKRERESERRERGRKKEWRMSFCILKIIYLLLDIH